MKIKRVLQGTALAALATAAWMGAGSADASAAKGNKPVFEDVTAENITVRYSGEQYISFIANDCNEIIVGIAKADKNGTSAKVSSWDVYEQTDESYGAYVDLQKVNVTKDAYIAVKTDKMETPLFVKIKANPDKLKAKLNSGTREVTFTVNNTAADANKVYIEGNFETTSDGKGLIDPQSQYLGAVNYYNLSGSKYTTKDELAEGTITDKTDSKTGKAVKLITVGQFPGKQVKLNIPKQANGPSIPVDYAKGTIKIKKGVELRVVGENNISKAVSGTAAEKFDGKVVSVSTFYDEKTNKDFADTLGNSKGTLEVRVAAKTNGNGKAASKWTRISIEKPKDIEIKPEKADAATVVTASAVTYTVSGASVGLQYTVDKNKVANKGLTFDNKSDYKIDYVVGDKGKAPEADDKGKVKDMKTVGKKTVTIKNLSNDKVIWVRIAGDKNEKQWASAWAELITVKIP